MLALSRLLALLVATAPATEVERQQFVATATREELSQLVQHTPPEGLLAIGERAVKAYGIYTYTMSKQERVNGTLLDTQIIRVTTRETPFAVRLEYIAGPARGRVVVYNHAVRPKDFRVHEAGILSIAGPLWLPIDSLFSKADSNYAIDGAGMGNLLRKLQREVALAGTLGGLVVTDEGWNSDGLYCQLYVMPRGGKGFDAAKSRICIDFKLGVPGRVESFTNTGELIGRFVFTDIKSTTLAPSVFDPELISRTASIK